jgi:SAM-dependent methyltransferase
MGVYALILAAVKQEKDMGDAARIAAKIKEHYGDGDLTKRLQAALNAAGLTEKQLSSIDLAPLDQFHTRGLAATAELAGLLGIKKDAVVIDIGSGLGGQTRCIAAAFDCRVHGIDLSTPFVEAATYLAERTGLADKVTYECADALALPFDSESFDLAWTQHVAMNIADRVGLYAEIHRVLRPNGRFAIYDVVAGEGGPLLYPVPWARRAETSSLVTPASMRAMLEERGFRIVEWADCTAASIAWFAEQQKLREQAARSPSQLGIHLAMGPGFSGDGGKSRPKSPRKPRCNYPGGG